MTRTTTKRAATPATPKTDVPVAAPASDQTAAPDAMAILNLAQHAPAAPLAALAAEAGIPVSTLDAIRATGRGPRTFVLGRRVYCLRADWATWMAEMAALGGVSVSGKRAAAQAAQAVLS